MNPETGETRAISRRLTVEDLRILWLTDHYYPEAGGMARSCDRIVYHLRQKGVSIDLIHFTPPHAQGWKWEPRQMGNDFVCSLKTDRSHTLNLLWHALEERSYTHIVAFGAEIPFLAAPVYSKWLGIPLVTCLRGNDFDIGIFSTKKRGILMEALESSQAIACVSRDKTQKVKALFPESKVHYTPNGIDLSTWKLLDSHRPRAQNAKLTLGLFGQLKAKKGLELFLESAIASGLAEHLHLHITGHLEIAAAEFLAKHRETLSYDFEAFGSRNQLPERYASCDYVVIPSFYDGMPNVLLEAGGLGVPVIASRAGGMRDVLTDGDHGFLFSANDQEGCIRALRSAFQAHDQEREAQARQLQNHIATHFTCDQERDHYLNLLTEIHLPQ